MPHLFEGHRHKTYIIIYVDSVLSDTASHSSNRFPVLINDCNFTLRFNEVQLVWERETSAVMIDIISNSLYVLAQSIRGTFHRMRTENLSGLMGMVSNMIFDPRYTTTSSTAAIVVPDKMEMSCQGRQITVSVEIDVTQHQLMTNRAVQNELTQTSDQLSPVIGIHSNRLMQLFCSSKMATLHKDFLNLQ